MMYLFALGIASLIGILIVRIITAGQIPLFLSLFLGTTLGLGIVSQIIFYLQLLGNNFNHFLPPILSLVLLGALIWANRDLKLSLKTIPKNFSLLILPFLAIPLWLEANHYPLGGWDAWSCWNLKAKFIYLGENHWKDMFLDSLWRSNTGYPLALPTINVWFWHWTGISQTVPMLNSILLTLLTAGTLLLGLQEFKISKLSSSIVTLALFTLSLGNTLSISQYSDILFALYLLSALICYLLYEERKIVGFLILSALFIGFLSFTKNEGLGAAAILSSLLLIQKPAQRKSFIVPLVLSAIPTVIFILTMAPHSQAFINGFISTNKPSTLERLQYILIYPFIEIMGLQWNGLWILTIVSLAVGWKKAFKSPLVTIGMFVAAYIGIVLAYYQINTFFEIDWWMKNTFNRIIFALMPSVFLWVGLSCLRTKKDA